MRKIIHVDMDCFYAAVEMRENPALAGKPIAIGGAARRRGVISTCNYIAREFGVRSAMPSHRAVQLCPQLLILPGRMELYVDVSQQIREIFRRYTQLIEPLSLDEAYLDVSDSELYQGSATLIAEAIRQDIKRELNLTASAGVAPNKFIAKIASDENKPDGLCVIAPEQVDGFCRQLNLHKIPGIGRVSYQKLLEQGLYTGQDIRDLGETDVIQRFGRMGEHLWLRSHGIDDRPVCTEWMRKSVGIERTLKADVYTRAQCWQLMVDMMPKLQQRLDRALEKNPEESQINKLGVKLKFNDFQQTTCEQSAIEIEQSLFSALLDQALSRQHGRGIRLVGLYVGLGEAQPAQQMALHL